MSNYVLLDNVKHKDLKVITRHSEAFGDNVNQVLVFPTEYADIQKEYPILFRRDESTGAFQSVALLGLDKNENLFLNSKGWNANYIPAERARGPFLIGFQQKEIGGEIRKEPVIHLDEGSPRISESEGVALFRPHGGLSPYLERISAILRVIHGGSEMSNAMFSAFDHHKLIQPVEVEVNLSESEKYSIPGYYTTSEERLAELSGDSLQQLNQSGFLRFAFFAVASLSNVSRLIEVKNHKNTVYTGD